MKPSSVEQKSSQGSKHIHTQYARLPTGLCIIECPWSCAALRKTEWESARNLTILLLLKKVPKKMLTKFG